MKTQKMGIRLNLMALCASCSLSLNSCQQSDAVVEDLQNQPLSIEASIDNGLIANARYAVNESNGASFVQGDKIGVFVDGQSPLEWTYSGENWSTNPIAYWPLKTESVHFKAFYPFVTEATLASVPMPDLKAQKGTMDDVAAHDFLVATTSQKYSDGAAVQFTDTHAFKHVSALIQLTIDGTGDLSGATLKSIQLNGTDFVSATHYSFDTNKIVKDESSVNNDQLTISLSDGMSSENKTYYMLVNALDTEGNWTVQLTYQSGGKEYTTDKLNLSSNDLKGGCCHTLKLKVQAAHLFITGSTISDWGTGANLGDLTIVGYAKPVESEEK